MGKIRLNYENNNPDVWLSENDVELLSKGKFIAKAPSNPPVVQKYKPDKKSIKLHKSEIDNLQKYNEVILALYGLENELAYEQKYGYKYDISIKTDISNKKIERNKLKQIIIENNDLTFNDLSILKKQQKDIATELGDARTGDFPILDNQYTITIAQIDLINEKNKNIEK